MSSLENVVGIAGSSGCGALASLAGEVGNAAIAHAVSQTDLQNDSHS